MAVATTFQATIDEPFGPEPPPVVRQSASSSEDLGEECEGRCPLNWAEIPYSTRLDRLVDFGTGMSCAALVFVLAAKLLQ